MDYSTFSASFGQRFSHAETKASAPTCYDVDAVFYVKLFELFVADSIGETV